MLRLDEAIQRGEDIVGKSIMSLETGNNIGEVSSFLYSGEEVTSLRRAPIRKEGASLGEQVIFPDKLVFCSRNTKIYLNRWAYSLYEVLDAARPSA